MKIREDALLKLLRDFFKRWPRSGIRSIPSARRYSLIVDNVYSTVQKSEIIEIIRTNPLLVAAATLGTRRELIDCDDYALQLKASITALYRQKMLSTNERVLPPAVGIVVSKKHALNLVISESEEGEAQVNLIDPSVGTPDFICEARAVAKALKRCRVRMIYI